MIIRRLESCKGQRDHRDHRDQRVNLAQMERMEGTISQAWTIAEIYRLQGRRLECRMYRQRIFEAPRARRVKQERKAPRDLRDRTARRVKRVPRGLLDRMELRDRRGILSPMMISRRSSWRHCAGRKGSRGLLVRMGSRAQQGRRVPKVRRETRERRGHKAQQVRMAWTAQRDQPAAGSRG